MGSFIILAAFIAALGASIFYFFIASGKVKYQNIKAARFLFHAAIILTISSTAFLLYLIITHQFQYTYVWNYSSKDLPVNLLISTFYAGQEGLRVRQEEGYPLEGFLRQVAFREEDRCRQCYRLRLVKTAEIAKSGGFNAFTTTLLYSRFQKHDLIRSIGAAVAGEYDIPFLYIDFREGWSEGVRISKALGLYRQPYCGCIYSERERYSKPAGAKREKIGL